MGLFHANFDYRPPRVGVSVVPVTRPLPLSVRLARHARVIVTTGQRGASMAPAQFAVASLTFERVPMRTKRPHSCSGIQQALAIQIHAIREQFEGSLIGSERKACTTSTPFLLAHFRQRRRKGTRARAPWQPASRDTSDPLNEQGKSLTPRQTFCLRPRTGPRTPP